MSLPLVSRFVQSSDDNYIHVKPYKMFIKFYTELVVVWRAHEAWNYFKVITSSYYQN